MDGILGEFVGSSGDFGPTEIRTSMKAPLTSPVLSWDLNLSDAI